MSADGTTPTPAIVMLLARDLVDSPYQPPGRSERGIDDLAASMKVHGILEPLIVRPTRPDARGAVRPPEIVCGHRRRAGALLAGLVEVPCIVRPMSDDEAAILVLVENGKRLDLAPLEEAEIIAGLFGRGMSEEGIADKIGKSPAHVRRRMALTELSANARAALAAGKLSTFAAEKIASLGAADQKAALDRIVASADSEPAPRRTVLHVVDTYQRPLSSAPWSLDDAALPGGACSTCPKRSKAQATLFDDAEEGDRCLDHGCYEQKLKAYQRRLIAAAEASRAEADKPTTREPKPSHSTAPEKPVDHEAGAVERVAERAPALIAQKISDPKRKLDDPKLWKLLVGLVLRGRWVGSAADVLERRGLPTDRAVALVAVGQIEDARDAAGLLVELLCAIGPEWTGTQADEGPVSAAARFLRIDLQKMKEEALEQLRGAEESKKAPKATKAAETKPPTADPKPSPKAIEYSVPCRRCKRGVDVVCKKEGGGFHVERTKDAQAAREGAKS